MVINSKLAAMHASTSLLTLVQGVCGAEKILRQTGLASANLYLQSALRWRGKFLLRFAADEKFTDLFIRFEGRVRAAGFAIAANPTGSGRPVFAKSPLPLSR